MGELDTEWGLQQLLILMRPIVKPKISWLIKMIMVYMFMNFEFIPLGTAWDRANCLKIRQANSASCEYLQLKKVDKFGIISFRVSIRRKDYFLFFNSLNPLKPWTPPQTLCEVTNTAIFSINLR